jgi:ADP-ribosylglycohydrolase
MFVGDALAMPAHWYYDVTALHRDLGVLRDYQAPNDYHPNSILPVASTGGPGRGSSEGDVVGSVILHGKKQLWCEPNRHYHFGLQKGDNTLNLLCVRVLLRTINRIGRYDPTEFLRDYVSFMTTPGSHNDTYAESYHRQFFANYARGIPPERCAGLENHDTASIGGLVTLPPVVFAASCASGSTAADITLTAHLRLTHHSDRLEQYAVAFGGLLRNLLQVPASRVTASVRASAESVGFPLSRLMDRVKRDKLSDLDVIGGCLSPACYIDQSFPAVLYLVARYQDDFEGALIANANAGGDNCHRGAVLGALLGAAYGLRVIPDRWLQGLSSRDELQEEIDTFVSHFA